VTITAHTSGDRRLVTSQAPGACSPLVNVGSIYNLGGSYESNQPVRIIVYHLNSSGGWVWWTQSPQFAASSGWAHATWTTPAVPTGATALSFWINLAAVGSLATDDYIMTSNGDGPGNRRAHSESPGEMPGPPAALASASRPGGGDQRTGDLE
jgi:hypothetical protein